MKIENSTIPLLPTVPLAGPSIRVPGLELGDSATSVDPSLSAAPATRYQLLGDRRLRPFQSKVIARYIENDEKPSVMVTAPTGSGKTAFAYAAMMEAIKKKQTFIYTAPLKAINDQKLEEFREEIVGQMLAHKSDWLFLDQSDNAVAEKQARDFVDQNVALITGDRQINQGAPIQIMTTEIYNSMSQKDFYKDRVGQKTQLPKDRVVVFDEFHYLGDPDRGRVWEESIMYSPPESQIILLSATVGNAGQIRDWINNTLYKKGKRKIAVEDSDYRPVKLEYFSFNNQATDSAAMRLQPIGEIADTELDDPAEEVSSSRRSQAKEAQEIFNAQCVGVTRVLRDAKKLPAIIFRKNRTWCDDATKQLALAGLGLTNAAEKEKIRQAINQAKLKTPRLRLEEDYLNLLVEGVASHHAGHLPEYKELVADLFTPQADKTQLLKAVVATSTLSAGINLPAKTTVLTDEGLEVSEFKQMAGRAGRPGLQEEGNVVVFCNPGQERLIKEKYIDSPPGNINSALKANYQTLFTILEDLKGSSSREKDKALERALNGYCEKSFMKFQGQNTNALKAKYQLMVEQLKKYKYIDGNYQLTSKGKIAKEIKFNNPIFVTEFIFSLDQAVKKYNQSQPIDGHIRRIRPEVFASVLSLFAQNDSVFLDGGAFDKFIQDSSLRSPELKLLLQVLKSTIQSFPLPSLDYSKFWAVHNWTDSGPKVNQKEQDFITEFSSNLQTNIHEHNRDNGFSKKIEAVDSLVYSNVLSQILESEASRKSLSALEITFNKEKQAAEELVWETLKSTKGATYDLYQKFCRLRSFNISSEIKRFQAACKGDSPGELLEALKRTAHLLKYLGKAARSNEHFPALIKDSLNATRLIFDNTPLL